MLNPSRADAEVNDPTITRCINFAKSWGYGRLDVVNLFAYRTSKPSLLKQAVERTYHGAELNSAPVSSPIGKNNDRFILESVERCDRNVPASQIVQRHSGARSHHLSLGQSWNVAAAGYLYS